MSAPQAGASRCALGFDVGERWVGVAIGNSFSQAARSLQVLQRDHGNFWPRLEGLIKEWQPDTLVVGDPLTLGGDTQAATLLARRFARQLQGRFALPVSLIDERHSSIEANQRFAQQRRQGLQRRRDGAQQDAQAAAIILQRWLDAGMPLNPPDATTDARETAPPSDA